MQFPHFIHEITNTHVQIELAFADDTQTHYKV